MNYDNLRFKIKKILKKLKILKNDSPDWKKIISYNKDLYKKLKLDAKKGQKILICTSSGGHLVSAYFEALLALALTRYGADVEIMLCDKSLKGCHMVTSNHIEDEKFIKSGTKDLCRSCLESGKEAFEDLGLKINYYSSYFNKNDELKINEKIDNLTTKEMQDYKEENIPIGEHAYAGVLRYYAVGDLEAIDDENIKTNVLKRFLHAALLTKQIFFNLFSSKKFDKIILNHAIYVPQGIICEVSKKFDLKIIAYTTAYRKNCFIFSYDDTYHRTMIDEDVNDWINIELDENKEKKLFKYLESRKYGTEDIYYYFKDPSFEIEQLLEKQGVNIQKPILGLLTNIIWDAQIEYKNNIFINMTDWLIRTIEYLSTRNEIEVVVRCHPGEVYSDRVSKQTVKETILKKFINLPSNLKIINADSKISTYSFADYCNTSVIYSSKMGIELVPFGNRVICAGESYIRNKGITFDPVDLNEYYFLLDKFPNIEKLSKEKIERAKKYAYHYFFRRAFQVNSLDANNYNSWPPYKVSDHAFDSLLNNRDKGLKCLSDSILLNKKFIVDI